MHAAIKTQWLTALRSGEYVQGSGFLHRNNTYCCLGVLCDLAVKAGVVTVEAPTGHDTIFRYGDHGLGSTLPQSVMDWSGVHGPTGDLCTIIEGPDQGDLTDLASLNDYLGYNFSQIADVIEEQF